MGKNSFLNLGLLRRPRMTTGLKIVVTGLLLSVGWGPATSWAGGEIPAIDLAIPETTQTATFAMG
jgi:hypothetical protein